MSLIPKRGRTAVSCAAALAALGPVIVGAGCAVGPNFTRPPAPAVNRYTQEPLPASTVSADIAGGGAQRFVSGADIPGQWWRLFHSQRLDALIEEALAANPDLQPAQLGMTMEAVGSSLSTMLGGGYVNYFSLSGRSYKVIPQVEQRSRLNVDQLRNYYIRTAGGTVVPVSTIAHIAMTAVPESLNRFQQLNAATVQGVTAPGVTTGQALAYLQDLAKNTLPAGYSVDYSGQLRQFVQESSGFLATFGFALIIIFLSLATLFESFRDPVIILVSVPMSIAGALLFIYLGVGGADLNIYTEVGLVTLMGLISKHGILIVEFANNLQRDGKSKREAVEEAAGIRLRPILMTTAAMVLGVVPLIVATGAGAVSRFNMGLVIASGLAIGTLFTLFVVPAVYLLIGGEHVARALAETPEGPALQSPRPPGP